MASPARPSSPRPRSRAVVLLVSCGLWLLYFDLLTSMPGCTTESSGGSAEVDGGIGNTFGPDAAQAQADSSGIVSPDSALAEDAPLGDAVATDAPDDAQGLDSAALDSALVDAPSVVIDASIPDAPSAPDAPDFIDAPDLLDAGIPDAPDFTDAPIDFLDAAPDA